MHTGAAMRRIFTMSVPSLPSFSLAKSTRHRESCRQLSVERPKGFERSSKQKVGGGAGAASLSHSRIEGYLGITFEILGDSGQVTSSSQTVDDAQDADERAEQEIDLDADGEAKSEDGEEGNPFAPIKPRQTPPTSGFLRSRHAIRCSGVRNVHALCDFLLSWKDPQPDRRAAHGTPILVSPRIFLHAALARAQIVDKGSATRADEGSNKAGTGPMLYQIELSGSLLLPEDLRVWLGKFVAKGLVLDIGFHDVEPSSEPLCLLDSDGSGTVAVRAGRKTLARIAAKNGMLISRYRSRIDV